MNPASTCALLPFHTATIKNTFGVGEGPVLLNNITCNHTHLELSQCVHPQSIGIHDCASRDKRAGVICPEMASFPTTTISPSGSSLSYTLQTTAPSMTTAQSSNHSTERLQIILLAVMSGVLALVVIAVICILCLIGVMRARKGKSETKLGGKKKT